nr:vegetative cell wall protein gp1-like [Aegilops tauschii subsp. strangulata]
MHDAYGIHGAWAAAPSSEWTMYGAPLPAPLAYAAAPPPALSGQSIVIPSPAPTLPVDPSLLLGAGYDALLAPPPVGGYGPPIPAPPCEGLPLPPVPVLWDPTLLAAQHYASSLSSSVGGGDWYMDPGSSGLGPFGASPRAPFVERWAAAPPSGPPGTACSAATSRLRDSLPRGRVQAGPGSPSPSYEVEPGTPPATPATGLTSTSPVASSAVGSADAVAGAPPAAAATATAGPTSTAPVAAAPAGPAAPSLGVTTRA